MFRLLQCLLLPAIALACAANCALADPYQAADRADNAMFNCFVNQAAMLDDHISDASTIARAIVNACHNQIDASKHATLDGAPPGTKLQADVDRIASNAALDAVLRTRAASRQLKK